ncbi:hypothetical protein J6E39_02700 [bacterium]|nr:hypothetical protein [bacterium]
MKKLAIMGSNSGDILESIVEYFQGKHFDIEITCLYDTLGADIAHRAAALQIKSRYLPQEQIAEYLGANSFDLIALTDFKGNLTEEIIELGKFVNIHPSLLPAFKGDDAIQRAFLAGVKVTGATVHWITNEADGGKVIAQYPILINNTDHYDDVNEHVLELENILYPAAISSILEDRVFDFGDLFQNHGCSGSCGGGCSGCHGGE